MERDPDPELELVICEVLSLENDYPRAHPTKRARETPQQQTEPPAALTGASHEREDGGALKRARPAVPSEEPWMAPGGALKRARPAVPSEPWMSAGGALKMTGPPLPSPEPSLPSPEPSLPSPEPPLPSPEPSLPSPEPSLPSPGPSLPSPEPPLPSPEPSLPSPEPSLPSPEPPLPSPEPSLPSPEPSLPSPEPSLPSPEPSLPSAEPSLPSPEPSLPSPEPSLPSPEPSLPSPEPPLPSPEPSLPSPEPSLPSPGPSLPSPEPPLPSPEPSLPSSGGGCRRRTSFSTDQLALLRAAFHLNPYPDFSSRTHISEVTGVPESRVQVWFQNRRARHLRKPGKPSVSQEQRQQHRQLDQCPEQHQNQDTYHDQDQYQNLYHHQHQASSYPAHASGRQTPDLRTPGIPLTLRTGPSPVPPQASLSRHPGHTGPRDVPAPLLRNLQEDFRCDLDFLDGWSIEPQWPPVFTFGSSRHALVLGDQLSCGP